jgi:indolepyruvate ferredoxin oxidoreductase alpha subunit
LGDEAVALGALHSGISGVYAYPGTPSTEITEYIRRSAEARERGVHSDWCVNEKTAMEAALGVSYVGRRALVCMKHVGLNVAADPFVCSAMTGTHGGLVVVVADDPSMHSSQNEQDSRFYGRFAGVPVLEPSSQQEAYDMVRAGFDLSEEVRLPVLLRLTTRMAHSRAVVSVEPGREPGPISFPEDRARWVLLPVNARRRYSELLAAQDDLERRAETSACNRYIPGGRQGVIACGIGYNYLMEAYGGRPEAAVLKISQYPLPRALVARLMDECDSVLVLEDGQPVVEEQLRGLLDTSGKIRGRLTGEVPRMGELTPDNVRAALGFASGGHHSASANVVPRPPALCAGCGHRDVYEVLNEVLADRPDHKVFSDIGCYTLGALPPLRSIDSCVDMGASITMAVGAAGAGIATSVAVIGDSTFTHSGITGLLDAVNARAAVTIIISDNLTTAMTGGQDSAGTGRLEAICLGVGVEPEHLHVVVPLPKNREPIRAIIKAELDHPGVSVIIPRRECIQTSVKKMRGSSNERRP